MLEAAGLNLPGSAMVKLEVPRAIVSMLAFHDAAPQLRAALAVNLPDQLRQITADGVTYLWSGPEFWLAVADDPALAARLTAGGQPYAAITDQTDGRAVFRVTGPHARTALAKLVPVDLHPSVFAAGTTALTLAGHISVQIWRDGAGNFRLACFRSFTESLYQSLIEACREYEG